MNNRDNILQIFAIFFAALLFMLMGFLVVRSYQNPQDNWLFMATIIIGIALIIGLWFKKRWVLILLNLLFALGFIASLLIMYVEINEYRNSIRDIIEIVFPFTALALLSLGGFLFFNNDRIIAEFDRGSNDKYDFEKEE